MKAKTLLPLLLLLGVVRLGARPTANETNIQFQVYHFEPTGAHGNLPRTPIPNVNLSDYALTFLESHADFALQVLDENGVVVYSTAVPSTQTTVILPSWLSGEYELRLYPTGSNLYFYGWIEL